MQFLKITRPDIGKHNSIGFPYPQDVGKSDRSDASGLACILRPEHSGTPERDLHAQAEHTLERLGLEGSEVDVTANERQFVEGKYTTWL